MKLVDIRPHPSQGAYYQTSPAEKIKSLAKDMFVNGLRQAVEVLPTKKAGLRPGTVIDGHDRVEAAKLLGWEEIDVIVRDDLADANAETIERAYLASNLMRKHLDRLDQARAVRRLFEIEKSKKTDGLSLLEEDKAQDRVGKAIGMSGRNLQR